MRRRELLLQDCEAGSPGTPPPPAPIDKYPSAATSPWPTATRHFTQVNTAGNTSVITSNTGPTPPTGVTFLGSRYFTVQSTAVVTGTTTVCFDYSSILSGNENNYRVYRRNAGNTAWVATTTTRDVANNNVCGAANPGLGLYAIGNQ